MPLLPALRRKVEDAVDCIKRVGKKTGLQMSKAGWFNRLGGCATLIVLVTTLAALSGYAFAQKPQLDITRPLSIEIGAKPITSFDRPGTSRTMYGRLEWRGGLVLTSTDTNFGGWSGLIMDDNGRRFIAISDAGTWLSGELTYTDGRPAGITDAKISSLRAIGGKPIGRARDKDAESITLAAGTLEKGTALIGFESNHRIGRFPIVNGELTAPTGYLNKPAEAPKLSRNASFESIAVLKSGRYKDSPIAIAERLTNDNGDHTGWIWVGGQPRPFYLSDIDGFDITDLAALPDGNVIVLERRFRWTEGVKMRLRLLTGTEIVPGARLEGETLFQANISYEIDNMESVAVHTNSRGETIITLLSDNNFNSFLQRTILLQFALKATSTASAAPSNRKR